MRNFSRTAVAICAVAFFSFIGVTAALSGARADENDKCALPPTPPAAGFSVTNLSGDTVYNPNILLSLAGGDASYAEISNSADFSKSSIIPYSDIMVPTPWALNGNYGSNTVYVRYLNSCEAMPSPVVTATVNYLVDPCTIAPNPPADGFSVTSPAGDTVYSQSIQLALAGGDASYMMIANDPDFSSPSLFNYAPTVSWTLSSGFGSKTVYVKFLNSCRTVASPVVSVTVNFADRCALSVVPPAGGFAVTSDSGSTVYNQTIPLTMAGGSASFMMVSNFADFSNTALYNYSNHAPSISWALTDGYGSKTVYVKFLNGCRSMPSPVVSVTVNYTPDPCTLAPNPPANGFGVTNLSGSTVYNPNILLSFAGGDAAFAEVSNYSDFGKSTIITLSGIMPPTPWALTTGYGLDTVYVRYLNSCQALPSPVVSTAVNYVDQCSLGVNPPANGFSVASVSGTTLYAPTFQLAFNGGDAAYAEVSNNADMSNATIFSTTTLQPVSWTVPGYGATTVYVEYLNSCQAQPSRQVSVTVNYIDQCSLSVNPPPGGFALTSVSGTTVYDPNIVLQENGGDAAYADVANTPDFYGAARYPVGYPYDNKINWTLPKYGANTIYLRFLNSCAAMPSPVVSVTVNYVNRCTLGLNPPTGGFAVTNMSGATVYSPTIQLGFNGGDATYAEVSNAADMSNATYFVLTTLVPVSWTLSPGFGSKTVYVVYLNSCGEQPSRTVTATVNYVDQCALSVTPPSGGFSVTSASGATVYAQTIPLTLNGGNAAYVDVSNSSTFATYTEYAYTSSLNWTLTAGFGSKTVYVRYLNSCKAKPSATVNVKVTYVDPCTVAVVAPTGGFAVSSLSGTTVHSTNVTLGLKGGTAAYEQISNASNFSPNTTYTYAASQAWTLTTGYGTKKVYVRYLNSCKLLPSTAVSTMITYSK